MGSILPGWSSSNFSVGLGWVNLSKTSHLRLKIVLDTAQCIPQVPGKLGILLARAGIRTASFLVPFFPLLL